MSAAVATALSALTSATSAHGAVVPALIEATLRPSLTLVVVVAALVATGTSLILDRSLVRVLLGLLLIGNGVAVLFMVVSGTAGAAPFVGSAPPNEMSDPLPQAMVLTAIVISLATVGFLLALAYRLWQTSGTDDVPDDAEDAHIQRLAEARETSDTYDPSEVPTTTSDELAGDGLDGPPRVDDEIAGGGR
ncbi:MAG: Na(+)/H(+) antiporter subunit C [Humibacillus sp.]|nr:Na(+)/H(+) antiporter subunit C [Humibacillus sp.]MDN5778099.1 Na(+)/H(+) antiporter subunit C [Humibacillus sp.]